MNDSTNLPAQKPADPLLPVERKLTRNEAHDLSMLVKDRAKVLRQHAEAEGARYLSEFEAQISAQYKFDQDKVWESAVQAATEEVDKAKRKILNRCKELGIPAAFAPDLHLIWTGRGQNLMRERRDELRRAARAKIDAMVKTAQTTIEQQAVDLRTKIMGMGVLSEQGTLFLESMATVTEAMTAIDFREIETELNERQRQYMLHRKALGYGGQDQN